MFNKYPKPRITWLAGMCILMVGTFILRPQPVTAAHSNVQQNGGTNIGRTDAAIKKEPVDGNSSSSASVHFAVIGDYGVATSNEADVASLVKSWNPDFITTVGDNNYPLGSATTIDENIGQYYHQFIYPYHGSYGAGAATNQFFPALGNHDLNTNNGQPYVDYFTLPGNERYYDFIKGPVHFFILDSDDREPDGNTSMSVQAMWLRNRLAASTSLWNLVYLHHAPYSSGSTHGSNQESEWPYAAWGADVVLAGHEHNYERIFRDGIVYFVNGLGGASLSPMGTPIPGSQLRYSGDYGAMLVDANEAQIKFQFITRTGAVIDTYTKTRTAETTGVFRPSNGAVYLKNSNRTGFADIAINYGVAGDYPVVGDWDGDGTTTLGIYRAGKFYLRNSNTVGFADWVFAFGQAGDQPIAGDWNGDGKDTIGVFRPATGQFFLRNSNSSGPADKTFFLGSVGDVAIAGDWTGKGYDTVGVFRPGNGALYLKNTNQTGFADIQINYGLPGDTPVVGDWDNNGTDTIGVYRGNTFYLRNSNTIGLADLVFSLGNPGDMPIAGNWDALP